MLHAERRHPATGSDIYVNGTLTAAASGLAVGWIDDTCLLVNRYRLVNGITE